ncbi:MAG: type II toxin-antitoxin system RelE/ParE family toxin [Deltaproteobacteria bacterium]|nr:type II toxin-antitoxin system RelE/ParE family toxin [Deltaproteobacteria bacterium]
MFAIRYHPEVKKSDLPKLDARARSRIKNAIEQRLIQAPDRYGKPLQRTLKGHWKMRVGDYRVVFRIRESAVHVFAIIHRKDVYRLVERRIVE